MAVSAALEEIYVYIHPPSQSPKSAAKMEIVLAASLTHHIPLLRIKGPTPEDIKNDESLHRKLASHDAASILARDAEAALAAKLAAAQDSTTGKAATATGQSIKRGHIIPDVSIPISNVDLGLGPGVDLPDMSSIQWLTYTHPRPILSRTPVTVIVTWDTIVPEHSGKRYHREVPVTDVAIAVARGVQVYLSDDLVRDLFALDVIWSSALKLLADLPQETAGEQGIDPNAVKGLFRTKNANYDTPWDDAENPLVIMPLIPKPGSDSSFRLAIAVPEAAIFADLVNLRPDPESVPIKGPDGNWYITPTFSGRFVLVARGVEVGLASDPFDVAVLPRVFAIRRFKFDVPQPVPVAQVAQNASIHIVVSSVELWDLYKPLPEYAILRTEPSDHHLHVSLPKNYRTPERAMSAMEQRLRELREKRASAPAADSSLNRAKGGPPTRYTPTPAQNLHAQAPNAVASRFDKSKQIEMQKRISRKNKAVFGSVSSISELPLSPNGEDTTFVTVDDQHLLWEILEEEEPRPLPHEPAVYLCVLSPTPETLASAAEIEEGSEDFEEGRWADLPAEGGRNMGTKVTLRFQTVYVHWQPEFMNDLFDVIFAQPLVWTPRYTFDDDVRQELASGAEAPYRPITASGAAHAASVLEASRRAAREQIENEERQGYIDTSKDEAPAVTGWSEEAVGIAGQAKTYFAQRNNPTEEPIIDATRIPDACRAGTGSTKEQIEAEPPKSLRDVWPLDYRGGEIIPMKDWGKPIHALAYKVMKSPLSESQEEAIPWELADEELRELQIHYQMTENEAATALKQRKRRVYSRIFVDVAVKDIYITLIKDTGGPTIDDVLTPSEFDYKNLKVGKDSNVEFEVSPSQLSGGSKVACRVFSDHLSPLPSLPQLMYRLQIRSPQCAVAIPCIFEQGSASWRFAGLPMYADIEQGLQPRPKGTLPPEFNPETDWIWVMPPLYASNVQVEVSLTALQLYRLNGGVPSMNPANLDPWSLIATTFHPDEVQEVIARKQMRANSVTEQDSAHRTRGSRAIPSAARFSVIRTGLNAFESDVDDDENDVDEWLEEGATSFASHAAEGHDKLNGGIKTQEEMDLEDVIQIESEEEDGDDFAASENVQFLKTRRAPQTESSRTDFQVDDRPMSELQDSLVKRYLYVKRMRKIESSRRCQSKDSSCSLDYPPELEYDPEEVPPPKAIQLTIRKLPTPPIPIRAGDKEGLAAFQAQQKQYAEEHVVPAKPQAMCPIAPVFDNIQFALRATSLHLVHCHNTTMELVDYILSGIINAIVKPLDRSARTEYGLRKQQEDDPLTLPAQYIAQLLTGFTPGVAMPLPLGYPTVRLMIHVDSISVLAPKDPASGDYSSALLAYVKNFNLSTEPYFYLPPTEAEFKSIPTGPKKQRRNPLSPYAPLVRAATGLVFPRLDSVFCQYPALNSLCEKVIIEVGMGTVHCIPPLPKSCVRHFPGPRSKVIDSSPLSALSIYRLRKARQVRAYNLRRHVTGHEAPPFNYRCGLIPPHRWRGDELYGIGTDDVQEHDAPLSKGLHRLSSIRVAPRFIGTNPSAIDRQSAGARVYVPTSFVSFDAVPRATSCLRRYTRYARACVSPLFIHSKSFVQQPNMPFMTPRFFPYFATFTLPLTEPMTMSMCISRPLMPDPVWAALTDSAASIRVALNIPRLVVNLSESRFQSLMRFVFCNVLEDPVKTRFLAERFTSTWDEEEEEEPLPATTAALRAARLARKKKKLGAQSNGGQSGSTTQCVSALTVTPTEGDNDRSGSSTATSPGPVLSASDIVDDFAVVVESESEDDDDEDAVAAKRESSADDNGGQRFTRRVTRILEAIGNSILEPSVLQVPIPEADGGAISEEAVRIKRLANEIAQFERPQLAAFPAFDPNFAVVTSTTAAPFPPALKTGLPQDPVFEAAKSTVGVPQSVIDAADPELLRRFLQYQLQLRSFVGMGGIKPESKSERSYGHNRYRRTSVLTSDADPHLINNAKLMHRRITFQEHRAAAFSRIAVAFSLDKAVVVLETERFNPASLDSTPDQIRRVTPGTAFANLVGSIERTARLNQLMIEDDAVNAKAPKLPPGVYAPPAYNAVDNFSLEERLCQLPTSVYVDSNAESSSLHLQAAALGKTNPYHLVQSCLYRAQTFANPLNLISNATVPRSLASTSEPTMTPLEQSTPASGVPIKFTLDHSSTAPSGHHPPSIPEVIPNTPELRPHGSYVHSTANRNSPRKKGRTPVALPPPILVSPFAVGMISTLLAGWEKLTVFSAATSVLIERLVGHEVSFVPGEEEGVAAADQLSNEATNPASSDTPNSPGLRRGSSLYNVTGLQRLPSLLSVSRGNSEPDWLGGGMHFAYANDIPLHAPIKLPGHYVYRPLIATIDAIEESAPGVIPGLSKAFSPILESSVRFPIRDMKARPPFFTAVNYSSSSASPLSIPAPAVVRKRSAATVRFDRVAVFLNVVALRKFIAIMRFPQDRFPITLSAVPYSFSATITPPAALLGTSKVGTPPLYRDTNAINLTVNQGRFIVYDISSTRAVPAQRRRQRVTGLSWTDGFFPRSAIPRRSLVLLFDLALRNNRLSAPPQGAANDFTCTSYRATQPSLLSGRVPKVNESDKALGSNGTTADNSASPPLSKYTWTGDVVLRALSTSSLAANVIPKTSLHVPKPPSITEAAAQELKSSGDQPSLLESELYSDDESDESDSDDEQVDGPEKYAVRDTARDDIESEESGVERTEEASVMPPVRVHVATAHSYAPFFVPSYSPVPLSVFVHDARKGSQRAMAHLETIAAAEGALSVQPPKNEVSMTSSTTAAPVTSASSASKAPVKPFDSFAFDSVGARQALPFETYLSALRSDAAVRVEVLDKVAFKLSLEDVRLLQLLLSYNADAVKQLSDAQMANRTFIARSDTREREWRRKVSRELVRRRMSTADEVVESGSPQITPKLAILPSMDSAVRAAGPLTDVDAELQQDDEDDSYLFLQTFNSSNRAEANTDESLMDITFFDPTHHSSTLRSIARAARIYDRKHWVGSASAAAQAALRAYKHPPTHWSSIIVLPQTPMDIIPPVVPLPVLRGRKLIELKLKPLLIQLADNTLGRSIPLLRLRLQTTPVRVHMVTSYKGYGSHLKGSEGDSSDQRKASVSFERNARGFDWGYRLGHLTTMITSFRAAASNFNASAMTYEAVLHEAAFVMELRRVQYTGSSATTNLAAASDSNAYYAGLAAEYDLEDDSQRLAREIAKREAQARARRRRTRRAPFWVMLQTQSPLDIRVSSKFLEVLTRMRDSYRLLMASPKLAIRRNRRQKSLSHAHPDAISNQPHDIVPQLTYLPAPQVETQSSTSAPTTLASPPMSKSQVRILTSDANFYSPIRVCNATGIPLLVWTEASDSFEAYWWTVERRYQTNQKQLTQGDINFIRDELTFGYRSSFAEVIGATFAHPSSKARPTLVMPGVSCPIWVSPALLATPKKITACVAFGPQGQLGALVRIPLTDIGSRAFELPVDAKSSLHSSSTDLVTADGLPVKTAPGAFVMATKAQRIRCGVSVDVVDYGAARLLTLTSPHLLANHTSLPYDVRVLSADGDAWYGRVMPRQYLPIPLHLQYAESVAFRPVHANGSTPQNGSQPRSFTYGWSADVHLSELGSLVNPRSVDLACIAADPNDPTVQIVALCIPPFFSPPSNSPFALRGQNSSLVPLTAKTTAVAAAAAASGQGSSAKGNEGALIGHPPSLLATGATVIGIPVPYLCISLQTPLRVQNLLPCTVFIEVLSKDFKPKPAPTPSAGSTTSAPPAPPNPWVFQSLIAEPIESGSTISLEQLNWLPALQAAARSRVDAAIKGDLKPVQGFHPSVGAMEESQRLASPTRPMRLLPMDGQPTHQLFIRILVAGREWTKPIPLAPAGRVGQDLSMGRFADRLSSPGADGTGLDLIVDSYPVLGSLVRSRLLRIHTHSWIVNETCLPLLAANRFDMRLPLVVVASPNQEQVAAALNFANSHRPRSQEPFSPIGPTDSLASKVQAYFPGSYQDLERFGTVQSLDSNVDLIASIPPPVVPDSISSLGAISTLRPRLFMETYSDIQVAQALQLARTGQGLPQERLTGVRLDAKEYPVEPLLIALAPVPFSGAPSEDVAIAASPRSPCRFRFTDVTLPAKGNAGAMINHLKSGGSPVTLASNYFAVPGRRLLAEDHQLDRVIKLVAQSPQESYAMLAHVHAMLMVNAERLLPPSSRGQGFDSDLKGVSTSMQGMIARLVARFPPPSSSLLRSGLRARADIVLRYESVPSVFARSLTLTDDLTSQVRQADANAKNSQLAKPKADTWVGLASLQLCDQRISSEIPSEDDPNASLPPPPPVPPLPPMSVLRLIPRYRIRNLAPFPFLIRQEGLEAYPEAAILLPPVASSVSAATRASATRTLVLAQNSTAPIKRATSEEIVEDDAAVDTLLEASPWDAQPALDPPFFWPSHAHPERISLTPLAPYPYSPLLAAAYSARLLSSPQLMQALEELVVKAHWLATGNFALDTQGSFSVSSYAKAETGLGPGTNSSTLTFQVSCELINEQYVVSIKLEELPKEFRKFASQGGQMTELVGAAGPRSPVVRGTPASPALSPSLAKSPLLRHMDSVAFVSTVSSSQTILQRMAALAQAFPTTIPTYIISNSTRFPVTYAQIIREHADAKSASPLRPYLYLGAHTSTPFAWPVLEETRSLLPQQMARGYPPPTVTSAQTHEGAPEKPPRRYLRLMLHAHAAIACEHPAGFEPTTDLIFDVALDDPIFERRMILYRPDLECAREMLRTRVNSEPQNDFEYPRFSLFSILVRVESLSSGIRCLRINYEPIPTFTQMALLASVAIQAAIRANIIPATAAASQTKLKGIPLLDDLRRINQALKLARQVRPWRVQAGISQTEVEAEEALMRAEEEIARQKDQQLDFTLAEGILKGDLYTTDVESVQAKLHQDSPLAIIKAQQELRRKQREEMKVATNKVMRNLRSTLLPVLARDSPKFAQSEAMNILQALVESQLVIHIPRASMALVNNETRISASIATSYSLTSRAANVHIATLHARDLSVFLGQSATGTRYEVVLKAAQIDKGLELGISLPPTACGLRYLSAFPSLLWSHPAQLDKQVEIERHPDEKSARYPPVETFLTITAQKTNSGTVQLATDANSDSGATKATFDYFEVTFQEGPLNLALDDETLAGLLRLAAGIAQTSEILRETERKAAISMTTKILTASTIQLAAERAMRAGSTRGALLSMTRAGVGVSAEAALASSDASTIMFGRMSEESRHSQAQAEKLLFSFLYLSPLRLTLSAKVTGPILSELLALKENWKASLSMLRPAITLDQTDLNFRSYVLTNTVSTWKGVRNDVLKVYTKQITEAVPDILVSSSLLGNPRGHFRNVVSTVSQLGGRPRELGSGQHSLSSGAQELASDTARLVGNAVGGVTGIASNVTGTIAQGTSLFIFDQQHLQQRLERQRDRPTNALQGIGKAGASFGGGILSAVSGLVTQPATEAKKSGFSGAAKGFFSAIASIPGKVITGALDGVTDLVEGVSTNVTTSTFVMPDQCGAERVNSAAVKPCILDDSGSDNNGPASVNAPQARPLSPETKDNRVPDLTSVAAPRFELLSDADFGTAGARADIIYINDPLWSLGSGESYKHPTMELQPASEKYGLFGTRPTDAAGAATWLENSASKVTRASLTPQIRSPSPSPTPGATSASTSISSSSDNK